MELLRKLALVFCALHVTYLADAQNSSYKFPVEGVPVSYTANYGELRPDHFHSGVDIRTDGVEGKRIVSAADGYISRISHLSAGFGLTLYVDHPDGTTTVYAHLQRFRPDIAKFVDQERKKQRLNNINLYLDKEKFKVKKGELIGYSGNSGTSGGPHLHFEVRQSADQRPVNLLLRKMLPQKDNIAPQLIRLHYIEVDTIRGVPFHSEPDSYTLVSNGGGKYSLKGGDGYIGVGRNGYFLIEGVDRKNGMSNIFGLTSVRGYLDGKLYFSYLIDNFLFNETRYRNAVTYYPLKQQTKNEIIRLSKMEGVPMSHYTALKSGGVVNLRHKERKNLRIEVGDDNGNISTLDVKLFGREGNKNKSIQPPLKGKIIHHDRPFNYRDRNIQVAIPAGTFYENTVFECENLGKKEYSNVASLTDTYYVMNHNTPLHSYINISMSTPKIPAYLHSKVGLATLARNGKVDWVGGTYRNGVVSGRTRNLGEFFVTTDTTAPKIKSRFKENSNLNKYSYVSFDISDELSGIDRYEATLNGEWVPADLTRGVLRYNFTAPPTGKNQRITIKVWDKCNNFSTLNYDFVR